MKVLTSKMHKAIELLAKGEYKQCDIATEIGVAPNTLSKWKKDRLFAETVVSRSRALLKESLPEVYSALTKKSKLGKDRHIKIFLDHLERLEEVKASQHNITFTWMPPQSGNDDE